MLAVEVSDFEEVIFLYFKGELCDAWLTYWVLIL